MKKFGLLLLVLLGLLLFACDDGADEIVDDFDRPVRDQIDTADEGDSGNTAVVSSTTADFQTTDCPFDMPRGYDIECGYLTVPEDRSDASSPTIELAVAIVAAPDGASEPPVVYLAGGPGSSGLDDFLADPESWEFSFLQNRDLILLDQRGTGYSEPTLDCPEFAEADERDNPDSLCFDRLTDEGINLMAYNTQENAADVAVLRQALGIDEWDLLGISYGTRLALEVMRRHPEGVRAVILDSPFPPNADTPVDEVYSFTDALAQLFADCEQDDYCREEYPDLENVFLDTVQRLNDEGGEVFGDDLVFALSSAFSDTSLIPLLPYVIYEVSNDNFDALDEISAEDGFARTKYQDDEDRSDSEGMYNSVICHDEYALGDYERVETAVVGNIPPELEGALLQGTADLTNLCEYWNPMNAVDNTAVSSNIPTLILVGQYDTATPPRWATLTAATLPNSTVVEVPGAGHSLLSSVACTVDIADDFLANPDQSPNTSCLDDIEWPAFE
ncbi:MAG: alpha/beta fold hydrolase [Ardenticatenaceae bacterium]|nr:alpha/beta fold hydrolase [Ardenticatenaceae bacterium]